MILLLTGGTVPSWKCWILTSLPSTFDQQWKNSSKGLKRKHSICWPLYLQQTNEQKTLLTGWWFQPIWKICSSKWESFPQIGVKIKNIWNHHLENINYHCWICFPILMDLPPNPELPGWTKKSLFWGFLAWEGWLNPNHTCFYIINLSAGNH